MALTKRRDPSALRGAIPIASLLLLHNRPEDGGAVIAVGQRAMDLTA